MWGNDWHMWLWLFFWFSQNSRILDGADLFHRPRVAACGTARKAQTNKSCLVHLSQEINEWKIDAPQCERLWRNWSPNNDHNKQKTSRRMFVVIVKSGPVVLCLHSVSCCCCFLFHLFLAHTAQTACSANTRPRVCVCVCPSPCLDCWWIRSQLHPELAMSCMLCTSSHVSPKSRSTSKKRWKRILKNIDFEWQATFSGITSFTGAIWWQEVADAASQTTC